MESIEYASPVEQTPWRLLKALGGVAISVGICRVLTLGTFLLMAMMNPKRFPRSLPGLAQSIALLPVVTGLL